MAINIKRAFCRIWQRIFRIKNRIADPFYEDINVDQIDIYQRYLDALFSVIDVDNYTRWSKSEAHDSERLKRDDRVMENVCCEDAASHGLEPVYLQVMINQYFFCRSVASGAAQKVLG